MTRTCLFSFVRRKCYHNLLRFMQIICSQGLNDNVYTVWYINRLSLSTAKCLFAMLSPVFSKKVMELEWACHIWPDIRIQFCQLPIICLFSWPVSLFGNENYTSPPFVYLKCYRWANCTESLGWHRLWVNPEVTWGPETPEQGTPGVIDQHPSS